MNELSKNSKNAEIIALLKNAGVVVSDIATIIDIRPTKTVGKSTIFCIAEVDLGASQVADNSIDKMSPFELIGQNFSSSNIMRGKMTMLDSVIEENKLAKGGKLELTDPKTGEVMSARLEAYEQFDAFYREQRAIGYTENNVFTPKLKQGKQFYRDSKVVGHKPNHQLIPSTPSTSIKSITEA